MLKSIEENEIPKTSENERNDENHYYSQVPSVNSTNDDIEGGWQPRDYLDTKLLVAPSYGKTYDNIIYPPKCIDMLRSSILLKGNQLKNKRKCCNCNDKFITHLLLIIFLFLTGSFLTVWCLYFTNILQNDKNYNTDIRTYEMPEKAAASNDYHENHVKPIKYFNDDIDLNAANNIENIHGLNTNKELETVENQFFPSIQLLRDIFSHIPLPLMFGNPDIESHENNTETFQSPVIRIIRIIPIRQQSIDNKD